MPSPSRAFAAATNWMPKGWGDAGRQLAILVGVDLIYDFGRGVADSSRADAIRHGSQVIDWERSTHTFFEPSLQSFFLPAHWVIDLANQLYLNAQFSIAIGFLVWLYLFRNQNYNFVRDIAPVAASTRDPDVMVVNPSFPAKTVPEFIAFAKANPGKINMASPGVGSSPHMAGELFKFMTGIEMTHVPYRGSAPAITDLLGGQVQVYFAPISASLAYVRAGKLRALAVTTAARSKVLPDIPTVSDFVPGYEVSAWYGIGAPKGTPVEIVDRLNKEINAGLADPGIKAKLAALGSSAFLISSADFGKFIADETAKWAKVIKFAGIKPD